MKKMILSFLLIFLFATFCNAKICYLTNDIFNELEIFGADIINQEQNKFCMTKYEYYPGTSVLKGTVRTCSYDITLSDENDYTVTSVYDSNTHNTVFSISGLEECQTITFYLDSDGDGFGDPNISTDGETQPEGYVTDNTDCDDNNNGINPDAYELAGDAIDQNCDGSDSAFEQHTFGASDVREYIYDDWEIFNFTATQNLAINSIKISTHLKDFCFYLSSGDEVHATYKIEILINDEVIASWRPDISCHNTYNDVHTDNVNFFLKEGDIITYRIGEGPSSAFGFQDGTGYIQGPNEITLLNSSAPPSKITPLSPSGQLENSTPTYTWAEDLFSTWYKLWIGNSNGDKIFSKWYDATEICSDGNCSVTTETVINAGNYEWYVNSWNEYGKNWSDGMSFSVQGNVNLPSKVTHVSPSSESTESTPTFSWNRDSYSTYYKLWIGSSNGDKMFAKWYTASNICSDGNCSVSPDTEPLNGDMEWYIKSWNEHGKVWSDGMSFSISSIDTSDMDDDGFSTNQGDCNDSDNSIYPGATEICGDGIDQNCDGNDQTCSQDENKENLCLTDPTGSFNIVNLKSKDTGELLASGAIQILEGCSYANGKDNFCIRNAIVQNGTITSFEMKFSSYLQDVWFKYPEDKCN